jgi:hypothetical protein
VSSARQSGTEADHHGRITVRRENINADGIEPQTSHCTGSHSIIIFILLDRPIF